MKTFRKRPLRKASAKAQSAMEYLMTYGWAILIISVVLAALFQLGVFNPMTFAPKAPPGSCQVFRPNGPYTTSFINLEGICSGELPQYVAQFNGQSSYIYNPSYAPLSKQPNYTVAAMVYLNSYANTPFIYSEGNPCVVFQFGVTPSGNLFAQAWNAKTTNNPVLAASNLVIPLRKWTFVALTLKNGGINTGTATFYVGTQNQSLNFQEENNSAVDLGIGFNVGNYICNQGFQGLSGSIANLQIYNTTLSANEIQALYLEGIGGAPINLQHLVGWWPLNGNANDYSGNGNNGQINNVNFVSNWYNGYTPP